MIGQIGLEVIEDTSSDDHCSWALQSIKGNNQQIEHLSPLLKNDGEVLDRGIFQSSNL